MKVAEKFISINGEGLHAGELAVFIRFPSCNMSCAYCDTKWANSPETVGEEMSAAEILSYIKETGVKRVTITGGEPLLASYIDELLRLLSSENTLSVEIETNGSVDFTEYSKTDKRPSFTMDIKCPSSGMSNKCCFENIAVLDFRDCVKFVVSDENDLLYAASVIEKYRLTFSTNVIISPVFGAISPEAIVNFMKERKLNGVRLGIQLHKIIWDPETRGV
ncbi:MAG: putative 7-carboxy-7-deazaguanine synthase QueE [Ruminococcus sp.]|nr:putative 7-carboxy-7-deazaguanine synthase QueE [Ruminococcus sp.]